MKLLNPGAKSRRKQLSGNAAGALQYQQAPPPMPRYLLGLAALERGGGWDCNISLVAKMYIVKPLLYFGFAWLGFEAKPGKLGMAWLQSCQLGVALTLSSVAVILQLLGFVFKKVSPCNTNLN